MLLSRRFLLAGASSLALSPAAFANTPATHSRRAEPVPARLVRLTPSPFAYAFEVNRRYLFELDPERLLHNFYVSARLSAPKPVYCGWEEMEIAGHRLGHWLTACSLVIANTGDRPLAARLDFALAEMAKGDDASLTT